MQMDQKSHVFQRIRSVGGLPCVAASAPHITKKPITSRATPMMMRKMIRILVHQVAVNGRSRPPCLAQIAHPSLNTVFFHGPYPDHQGAEDQAQDKTHANAQDHGRSGLR